MYNNHLDAFILTADSGSFSKAAKLLFISPNALIKQINLLEAELKLILFYRSNRGVTLTPVGESIYRDSKRIIALSKQAIEVAQNINDAEQITIKVGSSLMYPANPLIKLWVKVSNEYPNINLKVVSIDDDINLFTKKNTNIDIFTSLFPSHRPDGYNTLEFSQIPLTLTVPRNHPLSKKKKIKIQDLYGETILVVKSGNTKRIDELKETFKVKYPQIIFEEIPPYNLDTLNYCAHSGLPMISTNLWKDIHPLLVTIPCDWTYTMPYGIVYSENQAPKIQQFINIIQKQIS
ncbi:LysR family transcriptional regulator [Dellaglioa sp. L3N]